MERLRRVPPNRISLPHAAASANAPKQMRSRWRRRLATAVWRMSWIYLALIVAFWIYLYLEGDSSPLGTVILFGPLWVVTTPAMALAPAALFLKRRALLVLAPAVWIAIVPIMGFCIPWRQAIHRSSSAPRIRILTCNVSLPALDQDAIDRLIE